MGLDSQCLAYLKVRQFGTLISSVSTDLSDEIDQLEKWIGYPLPSAYREWLQTFESGDIDTVSIFGMRGEGNLRQQQADHLKRGWLNIAFDGCGNYYALVLNGELGLKEPIIFIDSYRELSDAYIVASDFQHFLRGQVARESDEWHWPFIMEQTANFDPDMLTAINVKFPWDEQ